MFPVLYQRGLRHGRLATTRHTTIHVNSLVLVSSVDMVNPWANELPSSHELLSQLVRLA